ncbi:hypothetical protein [Nodosilinea sp. LEGE 07298]|nr:hypothetical protein [Nodosilinea sp. LEGE 07298]
MSRRLALPTTALTLDISPVITLTHQLFEHRCQGYLSLLDCS